MAKSTTNPPDKSKEYLISTLKIILPIISVVEISTPMLTENTMANQRSENRELYSRESDSTSMEGLTRYSDDTKVPSLLALASIPLHNVRGEGQRTQAVTVYIRCVIRYEA